MPRLALTPNTAGRLRRPPRHPRSLQGDKENASGLCTPLSSSPSFTHRRGGSMSLSFSPPRRPPPLQEIDLQTPPSSPGTHLTMIQTLAPTQERPLQPSSKFPARSWN